MAHLPLLLRSNLPPPELALLEEVRALEDSPEVGHSVTSGSGYMRQYDTERRAPFGYRLTRPREEVVADVRTSRDYLRQNLAGIDRQSPECSTQVRGIISRLTRFLGEEESK